jgi:hypothetical protein
MQVTIDGVPFVPACASASRIGIAITTHNRPDVLTRSTAHEAPASRCAGGGYR